MRDELGVFYAGRRLDSSGWQDRPYISSCILLNCGNLGADYLFVSEIPIFSRYEIRSRIGGWDDKWV